MLEIGSGVKARFQELLAVTCDKRTLKFRSGSLGVLQLTGAPMSNWSDKVKIAILFSSFNVITAYDGRELRR
jgi:hypothetical protein